VKRRYLLLSSLLLILICSPALAHEHEHETKQVLVTVNPNLFAPGQDISNATYGATLRSLTIIQNPNPSAPPEQAFLFQYSPVFAEAVTPNCSLGGVPPLPCAPIGNSVFSYTSSSVPQSHPTLWGDVAHALPCLTGQCSVNPPPFLAPFLRVDFAAPTDSASVILATINPSDGELAAFSTVAAFDDTGQNIGYCFSGSPGAGVGCSGTIVVGPDSNGDNWMKVTFSDPSARISFIVAGASTDLVPVAVVQFDSPVSLQLAGLLKKVQGVGPGKSLERKAMFAETYYKVHDIEAACAQLTAFEHELKAQTDNHIPDLTALQLLSTTEAIEAALSCREPESRGPQPWD